MPCAIRWRDQPVPHADFAGHVKKQEKAEQEQQRPAEDRSGLGENEPRAWRNSRHGRRHLNPDGHNGEHGHRVAEPHPVAIEEIGRDERRHQSAQPEEQVHQVQHGCAVFACHAVGQRIGPGDHDAAAHSQQEHLEHDAAIATRRAAAETVRPR